MLSGHLFIPLKIIIHMDHTYQYARMSTAQVVTSVSDQYKNFVIAAVPNYFQSYISHLAVVHYELSYTI